MVIRSNRATTIIVPVYADWESLRRCIVALKKFVNRKHTVLLVNDCGPEADLIERNIKKSIKGLPNFSYHRNPKNLGFVRTCNRAVLELDTTDNDVLLLNSDAVPTKGFLEEMVEVLRIDKHHGTVSPRSNSAANSSVPARPKDGQSYDMEYSHKVYMKIKDQLPRYYAVSDSHGFCMLIKRSLVDEFGLFDEIYGRGNGEETDFCLRIREHGYKSLVANRAYVYHFHSRSFSAEEKNALKIKNMKIVKKRYPQLDDLLKRFIDRTVDSVDWFADVIAGPKTTYKIMIDLSHMPQAHDERAENIIKMLKYFASQGKKDIRYTIVTNPDVDEYFNFSQYGLRVLHMGATEELFHVGFCPFQILYPNNINSLNRMCLKFIYAIDDVAATLSLPSNSQHRLVADDALRFADKVIVSNKSDKDVLLAQADTDTIKKAKISVAGSHSEVDKLLESVASKQTDTAALRTRWSHINKTFAEQYRPRSTLMSKIKSRIGRT